MEKRRNERNDTSNDVFVAKRTNFTVCFAVESKMQKKKIVIKEKLLAANIHFEPRVLGMIHVNTHRLKNFSTRKLFVATERIYNV